MNPWSVRLMHEGSFEATAASSGIQSSQVCRFSDETHAQKRLQQMQVAWRTAKRGRCGPSATRSSLSHLTQPAFCALSGSLHAQVDYLRSSPSTKQIILLCSLHLSNSTQHRHGRLFACGQPSCEPARLPRKSAGLTIEQQTASAIVAGAALVPSLGQGRLSMELAALFSHGAAAPAAALLWRFRLLDMLMPAHAAHMQRHKAARRPRYCFVR